MFQASAQSLLAGSSVFEEVFTKSKFHCMIYLQGYSIIYFSLPKTLTTQVATTHPSISKSNYWPPTCIKEVVGAAAVEGVLKEVRQDQSEAPRGVAPLPHVALSENFSGYSAQNREMFGKKNKCRYLG